MSKSSSSSPNGLRRVSATFGRKNALTVINSMVHLYPAHVADKLYQSEEGNVEVWRVFVIRRVVRKIHMRNVGEGFAISEIIQCTILITYPYCLTGRYLLALGTACQRELQGSMHTQRRLPLVCTPEETQPNRSSESSCYNPRYIRSC